MVFDAANHIGKGRALLVATSPPMVSQIRDSLKQIGCDDFANVQSHRVGLEKAKGYKFAMAIFTSETTDMTAVEFLEELLRMQPDVVPIVLIHRPDFKTVRDLLTIGARGFLVPPFSLNTFNEVVMDASEREHFAMALGAHEEPEFAIAEILVDNLQRMTTSMRRVRTDPSRKEDLEKQRRAWKMSVEFARSYYEGDLTKVRDKVIEICLEQADRRRTRLRVVRGLLSKSRIERIQKKFQS